MSRDKAVSDEGAGPLARPVPAPASSSPAAQARAALDPIALASFFASLAHDLRSPLGVVTQALAELRAELGGPLTDDQQLLAALADRGLMRLGRIADAVSLTGTLEAGALKLRMAPLDLIPLLRAAAETAAVVEPRREVSLTCGLPETSCLILADEPRLKRALLELSINAIRYARHAARIRIDLGSDTARVYIEDDGQGVAADRRATLFDRFAPRSSRTGLGVGLANARDILRAHGGELSLEASTLPPGRPGTIGACFVISLAIEGPR